MLNLYKLQIFLLVADEGTISGAAESLYMAQASASQHIKELEASLGVQLFRRGRRGVQLTEVGEKLYGRAQEILQLAALTESEITNVRNLTSGELTVCGTPGITNFFFPKWLQGFRAGYAHIEIALKSGTTSQVENWVRRHICDIGFTEGEPDASAMVTATPLDEISQFVVVGPAHRWWARTTISLSELDGQQLITRQPSSRSRVWLDNLLAAHGIKVTVAAAFDTIEPIKRSVSISDKCFTVLPQYAIQTEIDTAQLRAISVENATLSRRLWLVQHANMPLSPFARAFLVTLHPYFPVLMRD